MIIADYVQLKQSAKLRGPNWEKALAWLAGESWKKLAVGKYEIDGAKVFALVQEYNTKQLSEVRFETHRRYIDVQMPIEGSETVLVCDSSLLKVTEPYNDEKDVEFLDGDSPMIHENILTPFIAAVYFPEDAHKPNLAPGGKSAPVRKLVLKVAV
jgi:YhcH/YjgK/YiaL family protein